MKELSFHSRDSTREYKHTYVYCRESTEDMFSIKRDFSIWCHASDNSEIQMLYSNL